MYRKNIIQELPYRFQSDLSVEISLLFCNQVFFKFEYFSKESEYIVCIDVEKCNISFSMKCIAKSDLRANIQFLCRYKCKKLPLFMSKFFLKFIYFLNDSKYIIFIDGEKRENFFFIKCFIQELPFSFYVDVNVENLPFLCNQIFLKIEIFLE